VPYPRTQKREQDDSWTKVTRSWSRSP